MIWLFMACGPISLEFLFENNGCENLDFDNPSDSEIILKEEDDDLLVQRTMVFKSANAEFSPTYSSNDNEIYIREYWDGEEGTDFCWTPTVRIINPPTVDLEFWWYIEENDIAENVVQYLP
jgi:hypothetical protein